MAKLTIDQALQHAVDVHKAGQLQKAHRLYAAILKVQPKHPDANHNTGLLTVGFGKIELALPFFKAALEANPSIAQFWYSYIVALIKLERLIDAKALLNQAKGKGIKGADFDQLEQKLDDANKALAVKPDNAFGYYIMGIALQEQGKLEEAIEAYNKALAIKPDYEAARTEKLHQQALICDWDSIAKDVNLIPELGTSKKHVQPFAFLSLEDFPGRHLIRSEIYAKDHYPQKTLPPRNRPSKKPKRIRIGKLDGKCELGCRS